MKILATITTIIITLCGFGWGADDIGAVQPKAKIEGDSFDWKNKGPLDLLKVLETHKGTYTVTDLHKYWVKASDLPKLVKLLDSQKPCAPVKSAFSSADVEDGVRSFIGLEAIFMIEGYQADQYPPSILSTHNALSRKAIWKSYLKRKSKVLSWYNEECNSEGEKYLACNNDRIQGYLSKLTRNNIGAILKGVFLTNGRPMLEGYTYLGEAKGLGRGVHLYVVELNKQRSAFIWVDAGGTELPLPTCPESVSHESAYGIEDVYTWKAVQPGHGVVHAMCIEDSWLKKTK